MTLKPEDEDALRNSKTGKEWDSICDKIKRENGGDYPTDWFAKVLASGLAGVAQANWK